MLGRRSFLRAVPALLAGATAAVASIGRADATTDILAASRYRGAPFGGRKIFPPRTRTAVRYAFADEVKRVRELGLNRIDGAD
jgi:hypothetical protein